MKTIFNISPQEKCSEQGSVLIYILVGVVLFAALGFALTKSGGDGVQVGRIEQTRLLATGILQYARALQTAIQEMKINGVADEQISFENNFASGYTNSQCANDACHVFLTDGGGVNYSPPEAAALDSSQTSGTNYGAWVFSGANGVIGVGTDGATADNAELLAILPWVQKSVCVQINALLHIANPGGNPPNVGGTIDVGTKFNGSFGSGATVNAAALNGVRTGCFAGAGTPPANSYHFYQVLLAR